MERAVLQRGRCCSEGRGEGAGREGVREGVGRGRRDEGEGVGRK